MELILVFLQLIYQRNLYAIINKTKEIYNQRQNILSFVTSELS